MQPDEGLDLWELSEAQLIEAYRLALLLPPHSGSGQQQRYMLREELRRRGILIDAHGEPLALKRQH